MDTEVPLYTGLLIIPPQSGFSINRISKKKSSNTKHCLLFKASRHGIQRLEISESQNDRHPKIVTLENCVKISQGPSTVITIITKTDTITVNALTESEQKEWVSMLQSVAFRDGIKEVNRHSIIEEDNELYCSSLEEGVYLVTLIPSVSSLRSQLEPKIYILELTAVELQLKEPANANTVIAKWPYRFIRKYGYHDGALSFEAGRKCETGEGMFRLRHANPQEIFRCMANKMKLMKKLIKSDGSMSTTSVTLDAGEIQGSTISSMAAGSRSPLQSADHLAISDSAVISRVFLSSTDSLSSSVPSLASVNNQAIPNKPPRRMVTEKPTQNNCYHNFSVPDKPEAYQNYEPITLPPNTSRSIHPLKIIIPSAKERCATPALDEKNYECIENITEAWKQLGIDDVKHTEHITTPEEDLIEFVWQRSHGKDQSIGPRLTEHDDESYDKLDFFGVKTKNSSPCYKTIVPINRPLSPLNRSTPVKHVETRNDTEDYEIIGQISPDTKACRLADDSYLGYGVLRKACLVTMPNKELNEVAILGHQQCNGLDYAIVSKPKTV